MVRELLTAVTWATLLASTARCGEIKSHRWPTDFVPQEIPGCEIPVTMDVESAPVCRVLGTSIKLAPTDIVGRFEGCGNVLVQCTVGVALSCSISSTGVVQGVYSTSLSPSEFISPGGIANLCVTLTDAVPGGRAGLMNVRVATVAITITSR